MTNSLTSKDLAEMVKGMSPEDMLRTLELMEELEARKRIKVCQDSLPAFVLEMQPDYKMGMHLKKLYSLLEYVEAGEKDRIAVSMGPRFGKSLAISILFPAWYLGRNPTHKIIIASHTADLAVDMLRKVRNIMQSEQYKSIFPEVRIAADAKAAGKWDTNHGGQAYAVGVGGALAGRGAHLCVHPETKVRIESRGMVEAGSVRIGERIWSHSGYVPVLARIDSTHESTVTLNGSLRLTREHPVWVFSKGWVEAQNVSLGDVLWTSHLYDTIKALFRRAYHVKNNPQKVLQPHIQYLGHDATALHEPECSKLRKLWSEGCNRLRSVVDVFKLFGGHGRSTIFQTHVRQDRQSEGIYARELQMGRCGDSAEQQEVLRILRARGSAVNSTAMGSQGGYDNGYVQTPSQGAWYEYCRSFGGTKNVPCPEGGYPEVFGWLRSSCARILGKRGKKPWYFGLRKGKESYLAKFSEKVEVVFGLLLGVRRVTTISIVEHKPRPFVNFMVGEDNTFIADTVLTHNCIVDDPFSEQDIINGNYAVFDKVYDWFAYGARTRLMPGGRICVLHTRWSQRDLIARLLKDGALNSQADQYEMFEFPAILNDGEENQKSLWPEQWSLEALLRTKASMPTFQWNAQYMQAPTNADSGIVPKSWFKVWEKQDPPSCEFILMSLDAAVEAKKRSDFNALTTWGVWFNEDTNRNELILLNSLNFRAEFPELKDRCRQEYEYWAPDCFVVEAKANGAPLIQEFRNAGVYIQAFVPHRGTGDKTARLGAVADIVRDGAVWVPQTRWAEELVEQVAAFPGGDNDDLTDSMVMALARFREGGFLSLTSDEPEDDTYYDNRVVKYY